MQCHNNLQFPDSRPRACFHRSLFVRRPPTRPRARGQEPHFTHRLVRCGSRVRQRTLRNLGRHFALPRGGWPASPPWARRPICRGSTSTPWSWSARARSASSASPCGPCGSSVRRPCSRSWACPVRSAPPSSAAWPRRPPSAPRGTGCASAAPWASRSAATARPWAGTPCSAPPTCSTCSPPSPCTTGPARASRAAAGSRWPAAAIPGRSATPVRRSRWAWCWTPAASRAAPGSWPATSPRAARCRPC